ncbi:MAG: ABC transporter permease subunit [Geopsychrobacter sp.]|nr:ABC transporter permease subunit [Geopsychrobacter sp.]
MAFSEKTKKSMNTKPKEPFDFFHDERVRSIFYQLLFAAAVGWFAWYLISNTAQNLEARGMNTGFGFLNVSAGFDSYFKLIPNEPGVGTYGRIFIIGALNTLYVSALAVIASTLLGFFIGVLRLSNNWLVSKVALAYVEIFRNTPLLIQVIFWYIGVFSLLPRVKNSIDLSAGAEIFLLNNRGLYTPWPVPGDLLWMTGLAFIVAIIAVIIFKRWARNRQDRTGQTFPTFILSAALLVLLPGTVYLITGMPLGWDIPKLEGFNFAGGASLPPSFIALLVALSIYHAAHMAETVRAGVLSVSRGQYDAARALGLRGKKVMSLVIIPQAMPAIVPPMISNWMSAVKNSSLAIAIGYPDLVSLFMQTSLNQAGYAVELVGMTMAFYMFISLTISWLLNIYNKRVQLVER